MKLTTSKPKRKVADRWTEKIAAKGFTPISTYFLHNYSRLGITTTEAMFIVHLMSFKWDEKHPRPGLARIAKRMGVTTTQVRSHARKLEKGRKLLQRIMRVGRPNVFNLTPLFTVLEQMIATDERAKAEASVA
jgi:hypothetical protein